MLRIAPDPAALTAAVHYSVDARSDLRIVALDSLTAIYHRASGQTHIVAEPVPSILAALHEGACDLDELLGRLAVPDEPDVRAVLAERLAELSATGLIVAR